MELAPPAATVRLSPTEIRDLSSRALRANGFDEANTDPIADTVTRCEEDGSPGHGLIRIPNYIRAAASGRIDPAASPTLAENGPTHIVSDGKAGFAPLAIGMSHASIRRQAETHGMSLASFRNTHHMHALWWDIEPLAEAGLVAMAMVATRPAVAVFGGKRRALGTNPIAISWPRSGSSPITIDMASSLVARGDIRIAAHAGVAIPEGWGLDADGNPSTDAQKVFEGAQLPFADHPKASNIALMVELLATALSGDRFAFEAARDPIADDGPLRTGAMLLAFAPERLGTTGFAERTAEFTAYLRELGCERLPGDRRHACRERARRDGVLVRRSLVDEIEGLIRSGPASKVSGQRKTRLGAEAPSAARST